MLRATCLKESNAYMKLSLRYGKDRLQLSARDEFIARHVDLTNSSARSSAEKNGDERVEVALTELANADFVDVLAGKHLGLLISDATRLELRATVLEPLFARLHAAKLVTVYLCTGTHDPNMPENVALAAQINTLATACDAKVRVVVHDARQCEFKHFGTTTRGTSVEIAASADECDLFLVVSDLKAHYFAGYSNPIKNYLPGIASVAAVRANHAFALHKQASCGRHPWHPDPARRQNPIAEDMLEALQLFVGERPHFALCTLTGSAGIEWAGGGRTQEVTARGLTMVDERRMIEVRPERYLIVSAGGHPLDESLYTAQRALELTRAGVKPGGEVLFLAECANGIGPPSARANFFERLQPPLEDVLRGLEEKYVLYSHKAWKFADYLTGVERVSLLSSLPRAEVESIHLTPVDAAGAQAVLDRWQREANPEDRVLVVDDASKLALR